MTTIYGLVEKFSFTRYSGLGISVREDHAPLNAIVGDIRDSTVGIEFTQPEGSIQVGDVKLITHDIYLDLHHKLKEHNEIVILDDEETYRAYAHLINELQDDKIPPLDRFKKAKKAGYLYKAQRDEIIARNVKESKLDHAFVGAYHAYSLHTQHGFNDVYIEGPSNLEEVKQSINWEIAFATDESSLRNIILRYDLVRIGDLSGQVREELEKDSNEIRSLERYNNLFETGRLTKTNRDPDFIGAWVQGTVPAQGYFEIYIDESSDGIAKGMIIDGNGDATFEGSFQGDSVEFTKIYTEPFMQTYLPGEIYYRGERKYKYYFGQFTSAVSPRLIGSFALSRYDPKSGARILNATKI